MSSAQEAAEGGARRTCPAPCVFQAARGVIIYPPGMLTVAAVDSPIGLLTLARGPKGLLRLALAGETTQGVADDLRKRLHVRVSENDAALADVREQLDRYFAGELQEFDVELDWTLAHGFHRTCCEAMLRIPYGRTVTYAELAADAGSPRAVRAAGQACATNPIAIIGPCHRVLGTNDFGGYGGGLDQKATLLALEGALLLA
jgi:methylated-DNA-[protein]-cysteine S-methyltransferase